VKNRRRVKPNPALAYDHARYPQKAKNLRREKPITASRRKNRTRHAKETSPQPKSGDSPAS
jgi:hypothetical protein